MGHPEGQCLSCMTVGALPTDANPEEKDSLDSGSANSMKETSSQVQLGPGGHDIAINGADPLLPPTWTDLSSTESLNHSICPEEWMVQPLP